MIDLHPMRPFSWTLVAALLLLAACGDNKQPAAAPATAPAVGVRPVALKGVSESFEFVGRIKAVQKVDVRARVEGFLDKVLFREGQDVKAGEASSRQPVAGNDGGRSIQG